MQYTCSCGLALVQPHPRQRCIHRSLIPHRSPRFVEIEQPSLDYSAGIPCSSKTVAMLIGLASDALLLVVQSIALEFSLQYARTSLTRSLECRSTRGRGLSGIHLSTLPESNMSSLRLFRSNKCFLQTDSMAQFISLC